MPDNQFYLSKNDTLKSIHDRRSIRTFTDQDVSEEDILTLLHAANMAPSAHNQQSWRFVVLRGDKKVELVNLVSSNASNYSRPTAALLRMAARSIASAPVVVAVMNTGELIRKGPELFAVEKDAARDFFRVMEIQSSAAAVENMLIAATSIGLSSVWLGILIMVQEEVLNFFEYPKGEFMAIVPIGYAAKQAASPKKKLLNVIVKDLG